MVTVVGVMSIVEACLSQWPTKRALAVAEGAAELLGLEELPGLVLAVLVERGAAVLDGALVVEEVPVSDVLFEHPAAPTATITVAAMANTNPRFTSKVFAVIWLSLSIACDRTASPAINRGAPCRVVLVSVAVVMTGVFASSAGCPTTTASPVLAERPPIRIPITLLARMAPKM